MCLRGYQCPQTNTAYFGYKWLQNTRHSNRNPKTGHGQRQCGICFCIYSIFLLLGRQKMYCGFTEKSPESIPCCAFFRCLLPFIAVLMLTSSKLPNFQGMIGVVDGMRWKSSRRVEVLAHLINIIKPPVYAFHNAFANGLALKTGLPRCINT